MPDLLTKPTTGQVGTIVFDLEPNGLLNDATRIHCAALHWGKDNFTESFNDEKYADSPKELPMVQVIQLRLHSLGSKQRMLLSVTTLSVLTYLLLKGSTIGLILAVLLWILCFYLGYIILTYWI